MGDNAAVIPFETLPGLPPLFLAFLRGEAARFFPDPPTLEAAAARGREIAPADGSAVRVTAGQQAGLFTGPLLAVTKAAAAIRLGRDLEARGVPARGIFWMATEDHDLAEVAQAGVLVAGAPRRYRFASASERNYRPTGRLPVPPEVSEVFEELSKDSSGDAEALARFRDIWSPGRTFAEAFRETFGYLLSAEPLEILDPMEERWREGKLEFFRLALERAEEVEAALASVEQRLREAGFDPQVTRAENDFPAFLIEEGMRRKITRDGRGFLVSGHSERFEPAALLALAREKGAMPSPAALLRPVLASHLLPVAATILGPSELAYHAQTAPLFELFGLRPPVFLPRPHLFPRGARERRAMEGLGLSERDLFRARDATRAQPPAVSGKLAALEQEIARALEAVQGEVEAVDPTLVPVVRSTSEKAASPVARLREKVDKAAERRDEEKTRRLEIVESLLAPEGTPPDRFYTPLTYRCRFGPDFVARLLASAECRLDGARFVEFE